MQDATAANSRLNVAAPVTSGHDPITRRAAVLAACSALAFSRRAPEGTQPAEAVKIGQTAPLTGPAAEAGFPAASFVS